MEIQCRWSRILLPCNHFRSHVMQLRHWWREANRAIGSSLNFCDIPNAGGNIIFGSGDGNVYCISRCTDSTACVARHHHCTRRPKCNHSTAALAISFGSTKLKVCACGPQCQCAQFHSFDAIHPAKLKGADEHHRIRFWLPYTVQRGDHRVHRQ